MLVLSISMLTYGVGPIGIDLFKKTSMVRNQYYNWKLDFDVLLINITITLKTLFLLLTGACDKS